MSRISTCRACSFYGKGGKSRIAIPHTCGKSDEELDQELFERRVMAELLELLNVISEREFYVFYGRLQEKRTQTKLNL